MSDSVDVFACSCSNFVLMTSAGQFVDHYFLNDFVFEVANMRLIWLVVKSICGTLREENC